MKEKISKCNTSEAPARLYKKVLGAHGTGSILDTVIPIILSFPGVLTASVFVRDCNGWVYRNNTDGTRNLEQPGSPLVLQCLEENRMVADADGREYAFPLSSDGENIGFLHINGEGCLTGQTLDEVQQFCAFTAAYIRYDRERCSEIEEAQRHKDNFLRNVSHELRTPLNGIIGMSSLLNETGLTEEQQFLLDSIDVSSMNLLSLVNELLDLSISQQEKPTIRPVRFDVRSVAADCCRMIRQRADKKELTLDHSVSPEVPKSVKGDQFRIRQILVNLLDNAVKFTESGTVSLEVSNGDLQAGKNVIVFSIRDSGIGISREDLSRVFESFHQVEAGYTRSYGGLGIGLSVVKTMVEAMGGRITAGSTPGKGSVFQVYIPLTMAGEAVEKTPGKGICEFGPVQGARILVAEDEVINRLYITRLLENHGYTITAVPDGKAVIDSVAREIPDLILMDVGMPVLNGIEVTKILRKDLKYSRDSMPVIALTAHAFDDDRRNCLQAGMNDVLTKPLHEESLLTMISVYLVHTRNIPEE